ncbi:hypothetical protein CW304_11815 [Bacillus sp. UFRGS-B20]|nr:hypothetical protein CW304_11815 [Bacillus sp. UFRGS-B20]
MHNLLYKKKKYVQSNGTNQTSLATLLLLAEKRMLAMLVFLFYRMRSFFLANGHCHVFPECQDGT